MRLRISTWNCFGMGQGLDAVTHLRAPFPERLRDEDVLAECAEPDVLCIQELLSRDAQRFFDGIGREPPQSRFRDDNRVSFGSRTARGSGLGIRSRLPLAKTFVQTFSAPPVGWDKLARKGILCAQIAAVGAVIDVINTHFQSGYDAQSVAVRRTQLVDLARFIEERTSEDRPLVVCGDFNIDGLAHARGNAEYRSLVSTLSGFEDLGAVDDLPTFDPGPRGNQLARAFESESAAQRIDYVFWRPARAGLALRCTALDRGFDRPLRRTTFRGRPGWPSDHYGLCATFED